MAAFSVETLRREFDGSFALPPREIATDLVDLLAIRVGERALALRVSELSAVATGRRLLEVPSRNAELLGLVGIRGALVAVLDLAALLGEAKAGETPRWVALCAGEEQLALGFHALEGHLRLPEAALEAVDDERQGLVSQVVREESGLRGVVSVPRIAARALALAGRARPEKGMSSWAGRGPLDAS
jgi:chemotaxis signal transduction protein